MYFTGNLVMDIFITAALCIFAWGLCGALAIGLLPAGAWIMDLILGFKRESDEQPPMSAKMCKALVLLGPAGIVVVLTVLLIVYMHNMVHEWCYGETIIIPNQDYA